MLKSKPIGWITVGTLVCLAGVALACRLRDGKGAPSEVNAAPWSAKEDSPAAKLSPRETISASQAKLALAKPQKPCVGEKVEDSPPAPAPVTPAVAVPPPPPTTTPPEPSVKQGNAEPLSAIVPPSPPATESEKPSVPAPPGAEAPPAVADAPAADPVPEPKTNLEKPVPTMSGKSPPVKCDPKPADPLVAETPEPKPETSAKKAFSPLMPEKPASAVTSPTPPPEAATCPPSEKPVPMPRCTVAGEPTYKVGDKGATLREIAKRTLGSEGRWSEIDKLNPELRSESIVPAGKLVRLPADAKSGWNVPGGTETQGVPPTKALAVQPLPVVRSKRIETRAKVIAPLTGTYSCKLDDKRGMVLPKEVCEQLDKAETVLLTPGPDQCLWLGTQASAARVLERVEKSGAADQEIQTFRRLYFSQSEKAALDGSGKLAISAKLAEYAGLGKEIVLIGIDDHFELWDAVRWQRYSQHKDASPKP